LRKLSKETPIVRRLKPVCNGWPAASKGMAQISQTNFAESISGLFAALETSYRWHSSFFMLVGMGADELPIPFTKLQTREIWLTGVFRYTGTWPIAISMVARHQVDLTSMVTARYDLVHVQDTLEASRDPHSIKPMVTL